MIASIGFIVSCIIVSKLWGDKQTTADIGGLLGTYLILLIVWLIIGIASYA